MVWELVEEHKPTAGETHLLKSRRQKGKWGRMLRNIYFTNDILCLGRKRNHTSLKCTHWNFRKKAHFSKSFLATKPILSLQAIMLFELSPSWRRLIDKHPFKRLCMENFNEIHLYQGGPSSLILPWFSLASVETKHPYRRRDCLSPSLSLSLSPPSLAVFPYCFHKTMSCNVQINVNIWATAHLPLP